MIVADKELQQKRLGENISALRKLKEFGIAELASESNYNRNSLAKTEYGEQNPRYKTLLSVAEKLDVDFPLLFSEDLMEVFQIQNSMGSSGFLNDDYLLVFVENCIEEMRKKQITQKDIYIATGLAETTASRILNRKNMNPTWSSLWALASSCQMTVEELFKRRK